MKRLGVFWLVCVAVMIGGCGEDRKVNRDRSLPVSGEEIKSAIDSSPCIAGEVRDALAFSEVIRGYKMDNIKRVCLENEALVEQRKAAGVDTTATLELEVRPANE